MVPTVGTISFTVVENKLLWYSLWILEVSLWLRISYCGTYCGSYCVYILLTLDYILIYMLFPLWLLWLTVATVDFSNPQEMEQNNSKYPTSSSLLNV